MTLSLENDGLLEEFRGWLADTSQAVDELSSSNATGSGGNATGSESPAVGLYDLVESFTALRQEVKLQTKGSRSLQEATQSVVDEMQSAISQFRSVAPREAEAARASGQPFAESLADLCDSLDRGREAIETLSDRIMDEAAATVEFVDTQLAAVPAWKRWLCRPFARAIREHLEQRIEQTQQPALESLLTGYGLIQQRLERALRSHDLRRINCLGRPADVNQMTVVEMVDAAGHESGTVVEEVRRGFLWNDNLIRFAEVKVAR